jgi:hypothetical protein
MAGDIGVRVVYFSEEPLNKRSIPGHMDLLIGGRFLR